MVTNKPLYFLATFPDPHLVEAPRGGYRRNVEMLRLLATQYNPSMVVVASHAFQVKAPTGVTPIVLAHPRMPFRWIKVFRYLQSHCSPQTPLICYNPTMHTLPAMLLHWLKRTLIVDYVDIQGTVIESKNSVLRRLSIIIESLFIRSCQYFITSSITIQKRIHRLNPSAKVHLYRGTFQPQGTAAINTPSINRSLDVVKIMYLGMMQYSSGVCEMLESFIELNPTNTHMYLAGHGPAKQDCIRLAEQFASGKVFFPELDDTQLHPFMKQMDILTVPYLDTPRNQANFPSKIIEYLWAGKAILGTQVGEIEHTLDSGQTALLVPPTRAGIRDGLHRLIEDQVLCERLGQNARQEFLERYSPNTVAESLCRFVADAANRK